MSDERLAAALTDVVDVLTHPHRHGNTATFTPVYAGKRVKAALDEFDAALVARVQDVLRIDKEIK